MGYSQNDLIAVTREVETTEGVVVGGTRTVTYGTAPAIAPGGNRTKSGINTGLGAVQGVRAGLRYGDFALPSQLVWGLNDLEIEDVMRAEFPAAEVSITASSTFANAGTHEDGTTGPTVTASASDFDDLIGLEGAMIETSGGSVSAPNKWPRRLKAVKSDGSKFDIWSDYVGGSASAFSEPLTNEGPVSATFKVGKVIRNQGVGDARSVNFELDFTDQSGGSYQMVRGCKGNTMRLAINGKGEIALDFGYVGMDYDLLTTSSQGTGTPTANSNVNNPPIVGVGDVVYVVVGATTLVQADNLTALEISANGNAQGIDGVVGERPRAGVTLGDLDFTGSMTILHEHTKMLVVQTLARAGTESSIDIKLVDPLGNYYWWGLPAIVFGDGAPTGGAKGSITDGVFAFDSQIKTTGIMTCVIQKFAAS